MKLILLIFAFILGAFSLTAQEVDTTILKVDSVIYMKYTGYGDIYIENTNPKIKKVPANYDVHDQAYGIHYSDKNLLLQLIKKWFTPYFKKNGVLTDIPSFSNNIIFNLHADTEGNIIGVDFKFSDRYDIPIQLLHQFSLDLQKSKFKLTYNKNWHIYKNAKRLERVFAIKCSNIRDLK
ncbi:hypothetical protein [uncultured Butyricimonas sp.]|uniref:hypothetical protein n=1 Tax=uncultured Butyricimonas sp. TaxID=1268785 RepID=UPI0026DD959D|nr:hypothetical protein [uncultured Butyricimonas sp.]